MSDYRKFISQLSLPYLGTPPEVIPAIFDILRDKFNLIHDSSQKFIDLGSGNGRTVIYSAINYRIESVGIEINKNLINEAYQTIKSLKRTKKIDRKISKLISIRNEDLFMQNLLEYDFIYIYSLPTMQKSLIHVFKTTKNRAIIVSFAYELKGFDLFLNYEYCLERQHDTKIWKTYFYRKL
jgi:16S rRNA G966 N2-methylase RsmD